MKSVSQANVSGKVVIVRADFDVPIENGKISEEIRIKKSSETIQYLLEKGAKVRIISHLGRPEGKEESLSLKIVLPLLENLLKEKIYFSQDLIPQEEKIVLYENLRFFPGEEGDQPEFAKNLSQLAEIYVNECFSVAHRRHASVDLLPKLLPAFAGINLEKEVRNLDKVLKNPQRPFVAIIGGAKIETKLPAISNLAKVADKVLVGGRLMFEIEGKDLPENILVATDDIDKKDIGQKSLEIFQKEINQAALVVWNGPMGMFEEEKYASGTKELARMVANSAAFTVVGGGDTLSALDQIGLLDKIGFVSMGGGAMLDFLSGEKLPALVSLGFYD